MRAAQLGATTLALSLTALLTACAGIENAPRGSGPPNPFAAPPPPRIPLFISPFGEAFLGETGRPWPTADWFAGADSDHDDALTFEEFAADGRRFFATLDTDRDGRLNQDELAAYEQSLRLLAQGGRGGDRPSGPGGPGGLGGGPRAGLADTSTMGIAPQNGGTRRQAPRSRPVGYGVIAESGFFNLPQPVKSADINVDQRVSAEEWAQATQRWFYSLDTDRDGKLTLATLPVTPAQAAASRR
ncbi:hypothetical protein [Brevundimonas sp.]|uniref:hypothetical protein n=1 Tax=Brevundimonas sp. TaxID=1871086 RepID=UPI003F721469